MAAIGKLLAGVATAAALLAGPVTASAADLPDTNIRVLGNFSSLIQVKQVERPFWLEEIPAASGGAFTVEYNNFDQMGIKEQQIVRLTEAGIADFATTDISKLSGDDPIFEGCDLAGITADVETARRACEAWFPVMERVMMEKFNTKLLGLAPNPGIVFWCREEISGLGDLKGKKVRVFNRTLADFVTALEATTVTTPFGEVASALQRGVFDCALTSTLSGNTAGWPDVTEYIYPLPVGWSIYYQSANMKSWESYTPEMKSFLLDKFAELDDRLWDIGSRMFDEGINCNIGVEPCELGNKASMSLVEVSDADRALRKELVENVVLIEWGRRCGRECAVTWNDTVGEVVGLRIPVENL